VTKKSPKPNLAAARGGITKARGLQSQAHMNVLFLCTSNSCRSIMAEAILNRLGHGRFRAYSAGSHPAGEVHPGTIRLLKSKGYDVSGLRSKSWDEFTRAGAIKFDCIITVCNNAAGEVCPVMPGRPAKDHWDILDPPASHNVEEAFEMAYGLLVEYIGRLVAKAA
jgi:protein-tyrosine-phosphatase